MPFLPPPAEVQPPDIFQPIQATEWRPPVPGAPRLQKAHEEVYRKLGRPYLRVSFLADRAAVWGRPRGIGARAWILRGEVWCARRTVVLQGIGADIRLEGVKQQLRAHWGEGAFDPDRPAVAALLTFAARPLHRRDTLDFVWEPGGRTLVRQGSEPWTTLSDRVLQRALLRIAFENELDPETPALAGALEAFGAGH